MPRLILVFHFANEELRTRWEEHNVARVLVDQRLVAEESENLPALRRVDVDFYIVV